jgi:MSHA biogenesis protein MshN
MSLLNEMLHDLAKQKPANQAKPNLTAGLTQPKHQTINRYVFGGAGFALALLAFFVFKHSEPTRSPAIATQPITTYDSEVITSTIASSNEPAKPIVKNATLEKKSVKAAKVIYQAQTKEQWLDSEMNKVVQALNDGHIKNAKALLQGILAKEPSLIGAREKLALIYLSYGDFANATNVLNQGLEYAPEDPDLMTVKAKILIGQNKVDEAIQLLKGDHPYIATHPDFYATLASALESKGEVEEAGSYYKSLIKVDPNNGRYWLGYAVSLENANQTSEAIAAYKRASQNSVTELAIHDEAENRLRSLLG